MYQWLSIVSFVPLGLLSIGGCDPSQTNVSGAKVSQEPAADRQLAGSESEHDVSDQQVPINQRFRSLDEYLAHLERTQGPVDGPWYREVRPGVYEMQTGNLRLDTPDGGKRTFTRQELELEFGFSN